jgi:hypothetical protein
LKLKVYFWRLKDKMVGRRPQRKKVASPPQEDPMLESSITTPQAGHPEPEPQPDPQPELQTESEPTEPVVPPVPPEQPPDTSPDQAQFARMSIDDGMESGESSYRTTMPAPEAITFSSPDVMEHVQDDDDSIILIDPCTDYANYSSWLKRNFYYLIHKKDIDFIDNNLELSCRDDLFQYYYMKPIQWIDFLGKMSYLKNWKLLIELNLIWMATIHNEDPLAWEIYMETRDDNHADVAASFKNSLN